MDELVVAAEKLKSSPHGHWKVLIVDDNAGIHSITETVLQDLTFENKTLKFLNAYNREEAEEILRREDDIALILLDVVMDEDDSGLQLVRFIRNEIGNDFIRIILRTGNPGKAPVQQVLIDYDINDYEVKIDQTAMKLFTTVLSSLRSYNDLIVLDKSMSSRMRHRMGLTLISETSDSLFSAAGMEELLAGIHTVILKLLSGNGKEALSSFTALQDNSEFRVVDARGRFQNTAGSNVKELIGDEVFRSLQTLKERNCNLLVHNDSVYLYEDTLDSRFLVCIVDVHQLELQDRQLLDIFASNVSMAFENLRLNREITGTQEELITRLSEVVETRSHDTAQHVRRVGLFCELIAGKYGMKETLIHDLKLASTMHDVGKIGIPDEILLKPGLLTEDEFTVVKAHTEIGYRLLKRSSRPLLKTAAQICLEHHERYDGTGYPKGIKGDEINLNSRIVSICDVFDSITHGRLHRDPWDFDRASEYLRVEKSGAFDPDLVDLFLENPDLVVQINHDFPD